MKATNDGTQVAKKETLTLLMSDLRGYSMLSSDMEPASLLTLINHYLAEMTDIILKYNGTILEVAGDGIFAVFGRESEENHATGAIGAAIEMQSRMGEINDWNKERNLPILKMGIGIDTGEVVLGTIGSEKWKKVGAVGHHVNLCSRIESYSAGTQILVSAATYEAADAEMKVLQDFVVFPKGLKSPIRLYHIVEMTSPYKLSCVFERDEPMTLPKPIPVTFTVIKDKHVDMVTSHGIIVALSKTGAVLRTSALLKIYDDVQVDICGQMFCKVGDLKGTDRYINFMAIPDGFEEWYGKQWEE